MLWRVATTEEIWHNGSQYTPPLATGASGTMLEDLDLHSIVDEQARELVRRLLNVLEDVMADLRAAQAENQRLRDEINRLKGEQGRPKVQSNTPQPPTRTTPRNRNGASRRPGRNAAKQTASPSTGHRWCRSTPLACHRMLCSRATRTWWCRTSSSAPTMSCSIKRSFTLRRNTRPTWPPCRRATAGSSALGSRVWGWRCTSGRR